MISFFFLVPNRFEFRSIGFGCRLLDIFARSEENFLWFQSLQSRSTSNTRIKDCFRELMNLISRLLIGLICCRTFRWSWKEMCSCNFFAHLIRYWSDSFVGNNSDQDLKFTKSQMLSKQQTRKRKRWIELVSIKFYAILIDHQQT